MIINCIRQTKSELKIYIVAGITSILHLWMISNIIKINYIYQKNCILLINRSSLKREVSKLNAFIYTKLS